METKWKPEERAAVANALTAFKNWWVAGVSTPAEEIALTQLLDAVQKIGPTP